jgi:hypothetical protein
MQRSEEEVLEIWTELKREVEVDIKGDTHVGDFFRDFPYLSPDAQVAFCRSASIRTVNASGATIEALGTTGERCYIVLSGSVAVLNEEAGVLDMLKPSRGFGESLMRKGGVYTATYVAQDTPVVLVSFAKNDFDRRIVPINKRENVVKEREYRSIGQNLVATCYCIADPMHPMPDLCDFAQALLCSGVTKTSNSWCSSHKSIALLSVEI